MTEKRNVVLYLDAELVKKSRELGFNLSKTFENHLKQLISQLQNVKTTNSCKSHVVGSPEEIRTPVSGSRAERSSNQAYLVIKDVEWATGRMRVEATKAAKLEVQNLLLSLANQQNTTTKEPQPRSLDEILMP